MTVRIQLTERVLHECSRFASMACTVGSLVGTAVLVGAAVVLLTSLH
jgi:hypothetical protein